MARDPFPIVSGTLVAEYLAGRTGISIGLGDNQRVRD
jgi:hypothetical protein